MVNPLINATRVYFFGGGRLKQGDVYKILTKQRLQKQIFCVAKLENDSKSSIYQQKIYAFSERPSRIRLKKLIFKQSCMLMAD